MVTKRVEKSVSMAMRVVGMVVVLCGMGCTSVRWSGDTSTHSLNQGIKLKYRYKVERICFTCPPASRTGNNTMMATLLERIGKSDFKAVLPQKRPDVFSESNDAIPIVVNVNLRDENSRWELAPYILTLGLLPGETHEDCLFQIDVQRISDMKRTTGTFVTIKYDFRMSLFTPLGLISFDHDSTVAICRETVGTSRDVQPETIAAAVVEQLQQLEAGDLATVPVNVQPASLQEKSQSVDVQQQVKNLKALRDAGTITEKEYQDMVLRVIEQGK